MTVILLEPSRCASSCWGRTGRSTTGCFRKLRVQSHPVPGRMAPNSALNFLCSARAPGARRRDAARRRRRAVPGAGGRPGGAARVHGLHLWSRLIPRRRCPVHGDGVACRDGLRSAGHRNLARSARRGLGRSLFSETGAGRLARWLIPVRLATPLLLGWRRGRPSEQVLQRQLWRCVRSPGRLLIVTVVIW